jgi:hypothetical protein
VAPDRAIIFTLRRAQSSIPTEQLFVINQSGVYLLFMRGSQATVRLCCFNILPQSFAMQREA